MIQTVLSLGGRPIVGESSGYEFSTAGTFQILKVKNVCQKYHVELINFDEQEFIEVETQNPYVPRYRMPKIVTEVDRIVDMPCLKGHSLTKVTFGIKNLFGILHRDTRRDIHATDLERGITELARLVHVDFVLVDGLWNLINAVFSDTYYTGILLAGTDVAAVDRACCQVWNVDYQDIPHIAGVLPREEWSFSALSPIQRIDSKISERGEHFKKQTSKYKLLYRLEKLFSRSFHISIIPYCHYYLGIRPYINKSKCDDCQKCQPVCPMHAIKGKKMM